MRRTLRPRVSPKPRTLALAQKPKVNPLEARELLTATPALVPVAHPMFEVGPLVSYATPPSGAMTPTKVQQAYGFNKITFGGVQGDGTGETIAIVDAQDDPNIQADLNTFDAQFGLPAVTVARVNQNGGTSYPAADSTGGWETEESLDVEWAHAMAPGANLMLVEASSSYDSDLLAAVNYAAGHANVVSMSWGGSEFSGQTSTSYDGQFNRPGVAFVASSGDYGAPISWPSSAPDVIAVGGSTLTLGSNNAWAGESGWSGSGGGPSAYESRPSYQAGVVTQTTARANPDVAYDANPSTGFAVYDSYNYNGVSEGWMMIGGTSAGAPQWAALLAIADQGRALGNQPAINSTNPQEVLSTLYQNATTGDFHDITTGTSTGNPRYSAGPGYDYVTGLGSPLANLVVQSLDGTVTPPASNDHLVVTGSTTETAGTAFNLTVTVQTPGGTTDAGYAGTVHFTSTDAQGLLPANYTFTAADAGSHTFSVTLRTPGTQSITVADTATSAVTGTLSGIAVSPSSPTALTASAVSTSQINLSWTGAAGAGGYLIDRSANGSTGWTQVGTTAAGTTSYSDTGLTAGTTYYYRVQATGGGLSSSFSNTASATTTAAAPPSPGTTDTLWSNTYTPPENAYSSGSYEVGVKFQASQAGTVTGARFYKQTWMGGYVHVGHLWASNGTLLASAMFTNESEYGWQQVSFSQPVSIAANTTYIISFSTGGGYFGITTGYFGAGGFTNGPLQALGNRVAGGDGVYHSGNGTFPSTNGSGMNFWADVAFSPSTASPSVKPAASGPVARTSSAAETPPIIAGPADLSAGREGAAIGSRSGGTVVTGSWPYRKTVAQALTLASPRRGWSLSV